MGKYMFLSIIIPIYNVENCISKCLDSLVGQFDSDVEIICIDDGSTDNSYGICCSYATKFENFKIYRKKNGGVASARNLGLEKAKGQYIAWIDPDDYVRRDWAAKILPVLIKEKPDCLLFDYYLDYYGKLTETHSGLSNHIDKKVLLYEFSKDVKLKSNLFSKVIKKELFNGLKFDESVEIFEDYRILSQISLRMRNVIYIGECLYYYVRRKESLTNDISLGKRLQAAEIAEERYFLYKSKGFKVSKAGYWKMAVLVCLSSNPQNKIQLDEVNYHKKRIKREIKDMIISPDLEFKVKIAALGYVLLPKNITKFAWNFVRNNRFKN